VFNMGIGMTIMCAAEHLPKIATMLPQAKVIGEIVRARGKERVILG
jgi:phosphoribosylaminoimidazole (AIR) synthetase